MKLILTEKPSVSRQVKDVLAPNAHYEIVFKAGKTTPPVGYYENEEFVICNSVGHIVNIKNPKDINTEFTWDLDKVPYPFPDPLPLEINNDKIFKAISKCFHKYDYEEVIIATDGDREGQNIWRKIDLMLPSYHTKRVSRMWLDEWTPEGIHHSYDNRFDNSEKDSLAEAARCREDADYIIGMDCTTALTCKYARGKGNVASIGRVMGPTMWIVYNREKEIENFVAKPYIDISLQTESEENTPLILKMKKQGGYTKNEAETFKQNMPETALLHKSTRKISKKCPELYDATSIAQDMNKRYGFSAKKTSDIIQRLYQDYALTTYPGTNARKISEGSAKMAEKILNNVTIYSSRVADIVKTIQDNHWTVAKHIITDEGLAHEAITPVYGSIQESNLKKLTNDERKVYEAIVDRYLQIFFPKAEFEEAVINTNVEGDDFESKGKTLLEAGWMQVAGVPKDTLLPNVLDGHEYRIEDCICKEKKTTPPSRYTEDTLLSAMKNAGRFVDDDDETRILKEVEGLGTGRTRPAIIENIKHRKYFEEKKKYIYPTQKCMDLFSVLPDSTLTSPSLTARFEQMIQDVEDGKMNYQDYMNEIYTDVNEIITTIKKDDSGKTIGQGGKKMDSEYLSKYKCPLCGGELHESDKVIGCNNWKENGCNFAIWKTVAGKKLTNKQIEDLLDKGRTSLIKGFTSRKGSKFDAYLELKDGKVQFSFEAPVEPGSEKAFGPCPKCGADMIEDSQKYYCPKCGVKLYKNGLSRFGKPRITKSEATRLLDGEVIEVNLVSQKSGKPYTTKAYFDEEKGWVQLKFD